MKTLVNKFLGFFTGDLNQSIFKICLRFIATNILLFFILAIPLILLIPTIFGGEDIGLGAIFTPFITFVYITPVLAIISTIRVFRASETKFRRLKSLIILFLPIIVPLSFFGLEKLLSYILINIIP